MRRPLIGLLAALALLVGFHVQPASAHFMTAGQVTTDGFRGECFVEAVYGTFGNGFAQVKVRSGEGGSCALSSTVEVTTAYQGHVEGRSCSLANAVDGAPGCVLASINPITWRAVAPGDAFSMRTIIRTVDGRQSTETHGAFGL